MNSSYVCQVHFLTISTKFCEADIQPPFLSTAYRSCYPNSPRYLSRYLSIIVCFMAIVPVELILPTIFLYQMDGVYARYISRVLWQNMVRQVTSLGYCLGTTCLFTGIARQVWQIFSERLCQPTTGLVTQIVREVGWRDNPVTSYNEFI